MSNTSVRRSQRQTTFTPRIKVWLEVGGRYAFGLGICEILQAVDRAGSIKGAAAELGKSYRHVWTRIKEAEEALGRTLVQTQVGGQGARRSSLTAQARSLITAFLDLRGRMFQLVEQEFAACFD
jgi:molybdate transport system regulatory protein